MTSLDDLQNCLQASETAREHGDLELAMIEAHNLIDAANMYALELSREFIKERLTDGTFANADNQKTI